MKDTKYLVVIIVLCVGILFLFMDKCGSSRKVDELKGQYEEANRIAKVERLIKEEIIKEQKEKIGVLDASIVVLNTTIKDKDKDLAKIEDELGELKRDFVSLKECQAQYDKLVKGFNLCKSINADKKSVIFSLNEKYNAQLKISDSYKIMYETLIQEKRILQSIVKAQDGQIKKLKLFSNAKTGIVVLLIIATAYGVLK